MALLRSAAIRQHLGKKIMSDKKSILSGACLFTDFLGVYQLGMG